ncbi:MAG: bifunctional diguanylate cyclase/phosphodiesterase [Rubrivivax sp.]|nr:bifunctional diguanylate cyclase/phosphodiesterase [Rubrivivax sp.]
MPDRNRSKSTPTVSASTFSATTTIEGPSSVAAEPVAAAPGSPAFAATPAGRRLFAGLLCLAVLPAALWLVAGTLLARQDAMGAVFGTAHALERRLASGAQSAPTAPLAAAALVALPAPPKGQHIALTSGQGTVLAGLGDAAAARWPSVALSIPLHGATAPLQLRAHVSLWPVFAATLLLFGVGAALAGLLWALVRRSALGALRKVEGRLRVIATRDLLTGLLNREGLRQRLGRRLAARRNGNRRLGVLLLDVDRFRLFNDSFGQQAGDLLLRAVAQRLRETAARDIELARLGDDQFAALVGRVGDAQALIVLARNLQRAFEAPVQAGAHEATVTMSIGIALGDEHTEGVDALLMHADAALRAAKARGGSRYCVYESSMHTDAPRRLDIELRLRRALAAQEFFLVYQPIVDASGTRAVTVEALLRWADPQHGVISPAEFVPVLEQTGLIVQAGSWVLREACTRARNWLATGHRELVLSVNVSPLQFAEPDFVATTLRTLTATGFPPTHLQLELTEGLLVDPTPETLRKMDELVEAGVRLAVDDFGIGYSSLAYLKRFRLHTLKVDRLFVRDVAQSTSDAAIVRAIAELGHGLGLHVCAEGVETVAQWHRLRQLGCDSMQGFLFARPAPVDEVTAMLQQRAAATAPPAVAPPAPDLTRTLAHARPADAAALNERTR